MKSVLKILTGNRYGRLIVLEEHKYKNRHIYWKTKCDCGSEVYVTRGNLITGNTRSCGGCFKKTVIKQPEPIKNDKWEIIKLKFKSYTKIKEE